MSELKTRAILMRLSLGLPGETRQDSEITADVKRSKQLGMDAGKWVKDLWPKEALKEIKAKQNEVRTFHNAVTLPFDTGCGILPGALVMEYQSRFIEFSGQLKKLVQDFLNKPERWIQWAIASHNGSFNPDNYPGCYDLGEDLSGERVVLEDKAGEARCIFDAAEFAQTMGKKFYCECMPVPVPDSTHFESTMADLLGTSIEAVDQRVRDAKDEGQKELFGRILAPVKHMADTLAKDNPKIFKTLIGNVKEICRLAPALNLGCDEKLNQLVTEIERTCTGFKDEDLKESPEVRKEAAAAARAAFDKLSQYGI
jgi:hypothetical protein